MWHVYVRRGKAFVSDVVQTEAGFLLDVEPVRVVDLSDCRALGAAIEQAMARGNRPHPTPTRDTFPEPVILRAARVRNWRGFEKQGACFTIVRSEAGVEIGETGRNEQGEWTGAPSLSQKFAACSSATDIASFIAGRVRQRQHLASTGND